jgi:hypothetical protein
MKRLNPDTNEPFKRGDVRHDGYVFFNYTSKVKTDGFFLERWLHPDVSEKRKAKDRIVKKEKYQRKSQRHSPGFDLLPNHIKSAIWSVQRINESHKQYGDMTQKDLVDCLAEYSHLSSKDWEIVEAHVISCPFNLRESIQLALVI